MAGEETRIPFLDLSRQHAPIADELMAAVAAVVDAQAFILGATVAEFEEAMAEYLGARHVFGVANGTDALYLSLRLLDLKPGDEVITSPFTFFATAGAIHNAGGRPVFVDIDPRTFNIDPHAIADAITERTRAIVAVHLFGQMAAMGPILELASGRGIKLIEDAAQAIGARASIDGQWRSAGTIGTLGCFSFYPTKNLGGWGDGGLVVTDDDALAERLSSLRVHGHGRGALSYQHAEVGINSRLDAVQAAVLTVKLRYLAGWIESRRAKAAFYDRRLAGIAGRGVATPPAEADRFHVYHLYTIRAAGRDELKAHLAERGIGAGVYYPVCLHQQPCFSHLGYREGEFPEAERAAREVLSLPLFAELTKAELERVVAALEEFHTG